jgi:hypothetical protein
LGSIQSNDQAEFAGIFQFGNTILCGNRVCGSLSPPKLAGAAKYDWWRESEIGNVRFKISIFKSQISNPVPASKRVCLMQLLLTLAHPRLTKLLLGTLLVLAAMVAFSYPRAEPDLWGHVEYGREALRNGLPATATHTFTATEYPWINHENIFEFGAAVIIDSLGVPGLQWFKCCLGLVIVGLCTWEALRQRVAASVVVMSCAVLVLGLTQSWPARPQVLSYTYYAIMLSLMSFAFTGWQGRWMFPWPRHDSSESAERETHHQRLRMRCLWGMTIIMALWTNSHGGFVAGLLLYWVYLGIRGMEALSLGGRSSYGMLRRFALMAFVALLATFINPYGVRLHAWIWDAMSIQRPEIIEWQPAHWGDETYPVLLFLTAVSILGIVTSRRSVDAAELGLLILTGIQSYLHIRHLPFFAITIGFTMPRHWDGAWSRLGQSSASATSAKRRGVFGDTATVGLKAGVHLTLFVLSLLLAGFLGERLHSIRVDRGMYPVAALDFMHRHQIRGRVVATYNWAQYLLAAFSTEGHGSYGSTVAFDGRLDTCYPPDIIDEHFDFVLGTSPEIGRYRDPRSPKPDASAVLRRGSPTLVLISRHQTHTAQVMESQNADWVLLYQDELAQLWGRREIYDEPISAEYLPVVHRELTEKPQRGEVPWPAWAERRPGRPSPAVPPVLEE